MVERLPGAVLCGAYSRYFVIDTREQRANIGVAFRPGGTWPFFDPAGDELQNQHVGLRELWGSAGDYSARAHARGTDAGRETAAARKRSCSSGDPSAAAARRSRFRARAPQRVAARLFDRDAQRARRTERAPFHAPVHAGSRSDAEALLSRIQRFQRVVAGNGRSTAAIGPKLAQSCGYFDQSHLIRECRSMSGFTPTELAARRIGDSDHVARSQMCRHPTEPLPRVAPRSFAFVFVTVLLDMLALGIIIPVLPKLVVDFMRRRHRARRARSTACSAPSGR